jgi:hypothetical protein
MNDRPKGNNGARGTALRVSRRVVRFCPENQKKAATILAGW